MGEVKQINIKNRTYYFYSDIINLKNFDLNLLKIEKKHYKEINIYYIRYIAIKKNDDYENNNSVNPLYLLVNQASGYIEEKIGNKGLIFHDFVDENKELLKKCVDVWDGTKNKINGINYNGENDYKKDYMKIEFNSDDNLELNKPLKFQLITKIIRSVFEDGKPYPQVFLDDALYKLRMKKMLEYDRIDFSGGIKIKQGIKEGIKQAHQKNLIFVTAGILKILVLSMSHIFAMVVMI